MSKKQLKGVVVSNKMTKTVVVAVTRLKLHKKYKKQYKVTTHYKAHSEKNDCQIGDKVMIQECRPVSKDKRWRVIGHAESGIKNPRPRPILAEGGQESGI